MDTHLIDVLGWTLIGSLWQGALIAILFGLAWLLARRWTAGARYGLCAATLLLLVITPAVTFALLAWPESTAAAPAVSVFSTFKWHAPAAIPQSDWRERCESVFPSVCAIWLFGVLALALRRAGGWLWLMRSRPDWQAAPPDLVARLKSLALRAGVARLVSLRVTLAGISPFVIGWLRPVILIPAATLAGTNPDDLEALLVHELAHIRRHDYLVNVLQLAIETILFYHPLVWLVSRQMRIEREHCCDDLAVGISGDPARYARALMELAGRQAASEFAVAATGGSVSARIGRLLFNETPSSRPPAWAALLLALAVAAIVIAADNHQAITQPEPNHTAPAAVSSDKRSAFPETREASHLLNVAEAEEAEEAPQAPEPPDPPDPPDSADDRGDDHGEWLTAMMHSGLRHLSIEQLIDLRNHGVSPEMARAAVHENPDATPEDVEELAIHGVTPEYVDAMHALVSPSLTLKDLVKMQIHGVAPDYAKEMTAALGVKPSADDLIKMRIHGVDAEFAERVKHNGFPNVSTEQLIRMRIAGL
jgi:beta-lactamase regulating signal transducer with metallopeptidase domain